MVTRPARDPPGGGERRDAGFVSAPPGDRQAGFQTMHGAPQQPQHPGVPQRMDHYSHSQQQPQQQAQRAHHQPPPQQQPLRQLMRPHARQQVMPSPTAAWMGWPPPGPHLASAAGGAGPGWPQHRPYPAMHTVNAWPSSQAQQATPRAAVQAPFGQHPRGMHPGAYAQQPTPSPCYPEFHSAPLASGTPVQQLHRGPVSSGPHHAWPQVHSGMPQGQMDGLPMHAPGAAPANAHHTPPMQQSGMMPGLGRGHLTAPLPARTPVLCANRRTHATAFPPPHSVPVPAAHKRVCPDGITHGASSHVSLPPGHTEVVTSANVSVAQREGAPSAAVAGAGGASTVPAEFTSSEVRRLQQLAEKGRLQPQERERVLHHWVLSDDGAAAGAASGGAGGRTWAGTRKGKGLSTAKEDPRAFVAVKRGAAAAGGKDAGRPRTAGGSAAAAAAAALFTPAGALEACGGGGADGDEGGVQDAQAATPAVAIPASAALHGTAHPRAVLSGIGDKAWVAGDAVSGMAARHVDAENDGAVSNGSAAGAACAGRQTAASQGCCGAAAEKPAGRAEVGHPGRGGGRAGSRPRFSCPRVTRTPPQAELVRPQSEAVPGMGADATGQGAGLLEERPAGDGVRPGLRRPVIAGMPSAGGGAAAAEMVRSGWTTVTGDDVRVSRVALEAARAHTTLQNSLVQGEE